MQKDINISENITKRIYLNFQISALLGTAWKSRGLKMLDTTVLLCGVGGAHVKRKVLYV